MVKLLADGNQAEAGKLLEGLQPLFDLVTVKTMEASPFGEVVCRARNPLAFKTLMTILGMPSGGCRRPLGLMTRNGIETVLSAARSVQSNHPEILKPVEDFFGVNIAERLETPALWESLYYDEY
jgi:4-hydroxy-tetrahydrodipicolinate synthase